MSDFHYNSPEIPDQGLATSVWIVPCLLAHCLSFDIHLIDIFFLHLFTVQLFIQPCPGWVQIVILLPRGFHPGLLFIKPFQGFSYPAFHS